MHLRIRNVSKTYPNGVRAPEDVYFGTMVGHIGRRREQPEPAVAP